MPSAMACVVRSVPPCLRKTAWAFFVRRSWLVSAVPMDKYIVSFARLYVIVSSCGPLGQGKESRKPFGIRDLRLSLAAGRGGRSVQRRPLGPQPAPAGSGWRRAPSEPRSRAGTGTTCPSRFAISPVQGGGASSGTAVGLAVTESTPWGLLGGECIPRSGKSEPERRGRGAAIS